MRDAPLTVREPGASAGALPGSGPGRSGELGRIPAAELLERVLAVPPNPTPFVKFGRKQHRFYRGIRIKADENLHDHICGVLSHHGALKARQRVLDLGCGGGALSQRLHDLGQDVLSVDIDREGFMAETRFEHVDLDDPAGLARFVAAHERTFDVVIASEVIEHVRNPWAFMESIRELLRDGGMAVISTPNTGSLLSRLVFFLTGNIFQFEESDLSYGHITPISLLKMSVIAADTGWRIRSWSPGGCLPLVWLTASPKHLLYTLASLLLRPFLKGSTQGWCLVYCLSKD